VLRCAEVRDSAKKQRKAVSSRHGAAPSKRGVRCCVRARAACRPKRFLCARCYKETAASSAQVANSASSARPLKLESIRASELLSTEGKSSLAAALLGTAPTNIDAEALGRAVRALVQMLQAEANKQHAYIFHFPNGWISLELEWIDVEAIARTVITTYVEHMSTAKPF